MDEDACLRAYLALRHCEQLASARFARLLQTHGSLSALLAEHPDLAAVVARPNKATQERIDAELRWAEQPGHALLVYESRHYPTSLHTIASPPPVLAVRGDAHCLQRPQLAMVGSRRCSAYGEDTARWLAFELAGCRLGITSGLARGIDTLAHQGALAAGGFTVAVVATGLDQIYPRSNAALAEQCTTHGAMISEFPLGTPPLPAYFPQRNRIISGLSVGVLVVEASLQSGSLITARLAMEQNRDVYAVPGQINRSWAEGCHQLIKSGAKLVEQPGDVLSDLPAEVLEQLHPDGADSRQDAETGKSASVPVNEMDKIGKTEKLERLIDQRCRAILQALRHDDLVFETLQSRCRLPTETLSTCLLQLEIQGLVCHRDGRIGRRSNNAQLAE